MRAILCFMMCAAGCLSVLGAEAMPSALADGGHYASVHGLKMYYEIHGQGRPLLLLHGGLGSIPLWPQAIEYFSKDYRVIAPEQMGHGRTADDPARAMDYHAMAEDTAELLRRLDTQEVYVLGWSDGGDVGLDLAINHPDLVKKLAVSGANFQPDIPATPADTDKPAASDIPSFIREPYERLSPDGAAHWPVLVERVRRMWQTQPNFTPAQLASITASTLVIAGDRDFYSPEYTTKLWRQIPRAHLWIAADSPHDLPISRAPLFNSVVGDFLKEPAR